MLNGEGSDEFIGADFANQGEARDGAGCEDYFDELRRFQRTEQLTLETIAVEGWLGRTVFGRPLLARASGRPLPAHPWHRRFEYCLDGFASSVGWRDDRIAAANGMASEAPFMDHRLLEFVARIQRVEQPRVHHLVRLQHHVAGRHGAVEAVADEDAVEPRAQAAGKAPVEGRGDAPGRPCERLTPAGLRQYGGAAHGTGSFCLSYQAGCAKRKKRPADPTRDHMKIC